MIYSIYHLDADKPFSGISQGSLAVLSNDAPVWMYCNLLHECIKAGAGAVAIAHSIDVTKDTDSAIIAYSTDPDYQVGETLRECVERHKNKAATKN